MLRKKGPNMVMKIQEEKITPKQALLLEENPSIKYLIEKLDCEVKTSPKIKLSQRVSARVDYWFENIEQK